MARRVAPWMVGVKEREKERTREAKKHTEYGVVEHSSGPGGGYVVRTITIQDDGSRYLPSPYTNAKILYVSKSEKIAQRKADQMNGF